MISLTIYMNADWELRARLQAEKSRSSALTTSLAALGLQREQERGEWVREWEDREKALRQEIVRLREAAALGNAVKEDNKRLESELERLRKAANLNSDSLKDRPRPGSDLGGDKENRATGLYPESGEMALIRTRCYELVTICTGLRAVNETLTEQIESQREQYSDKLQSARSEAAALQISLQIAKADQLRSEEELTQVLELTQTRLLALETQLAAHTHPSPPKPRLHQRSKHC